MLGITFMALPILWHFPISHFNEKARWALDYKRVPHVRRALALDYLFRAWWRTGQGSLPILLVEDRAIPDSTCIIAELERLHPQPALYPSDEAARQRALELEDYFDEELGHPIRTFLVGDLWDRDPAAALRLLKTGMNSRVMDSAARLLPLFRVFYKRRHGIGPETRARAEDQVWGAFDRLEKELGGADYLVGDAFSVADLTAASLISVVVGPPEFPYPPDDDVFPDWMREIRASASARPAGRWTLEMYRRHRGKSHETAPG
jgi:glutathione S-transferase